MTSGIVPERERVGSTGGRPVAMASAEPKRFPTPAWLDQSPSRSLAGTRAGPVVVYVVGIDAPSGERTRQIAGKEAGWIEKSPRWLDSRITPNSVVRRNT